MHDRFTHTEHEEMDAAATRRGRRRAGGIMLAAAAGLALGAVPLMAQAQSAKKDVLYDTQTQASGSCPGMAWHVVVHPDKTLNGMVSWDNSRHMAHVTGTVDEQGAIKANAVESAGGKTDTVTGTVKGSAMKASIDGTGTGCDNQTMNVPMAANASTSG